MADFTVQSMLGALLSTCHASQVKPVPLLEAPKSGICLLVGARQCGKSMLAKTLASHCKQVLTLDRWDENALLQGQHDCIHFEVSFEPGVWRRHAMHRFLREASQRSLLVIFECDCAPAMTLEIKRQIDYVFAFADSQPDRLYKAFFGHLQVNPSLRLTACSPTHFGACLPSTPATMELWC
jgi:hypothetical protein